jgi:hypothetical protein
MSAYKDKNGNEPDAFIGECMDCKFYYDDKIPITVGCGECRYGPPTAIDPLGHGTYFGGHFPVVSECEWCGRFEQKRKK